MQAPPTSCVLIKKLAEGTAYANTEGTYVEERATNFHGRKIWVNADKDRFIFYNKPSGQWTVTAMQYKEGILKEPDKNHGGFQGSERSEAKVPWGCGWKDMACCEGRGSVPSFIDSPFCDRTKYIEWLELLAAGTVKLGARRCTLVKPDAPGTAYAATEGTYVETPIVDFNSRPIWENADKARFIFYNAAVSAWIVTAMQYKEDILKEPNKNWGGFQSSEPTESTVPWECGWKDMACHAASPAV